MAKAKINLEAALRQLHAEPMPPQARQQLLERMREQYPESFSLSQPASPLPPPRRARLVLPAGRAGRLAAAALILIATLGVVWWLLSGSAAIASVSFAQVVRKVRQVETVRYEMTVYADQRFADRLKVSFARSGQLVRQDSMTAGSTVIYDFLQGKRLILSKEQEATGTLSDMVADGGWDEPVRALANLADSAGKPCGTEIVRGRQTEVFDVASPEQNMRLWVDPTTMLPVKVQVSTPAEPTAGATTMVVVIEHIEWDCPLDPSLFALTLPDGYLWASERIAAATEQDLLAMLDIWARLNDNRFPQKLDRPSMLGFVEGKLRSQGKVRSFHLGKSQNTGFIIEGIWQEAIDKSRLGLRFVRKVESSDWHWQGGSVALGDADTPIAWWREKDLDTYRIVYGDLTIRDCAAAELPASRPAASAPAE